MLQCISPLSRVKKTQLLSIEEQKQKEDKAKQVSTIDKALEALKGPKAVSTVTKSSQDWENYKEQEGIGDELAAAAKDG